MAGGGRRGCALTATRRPSAGLELQSHFRKAILGALIVALLLLPLPALAADRQGAARIDPVLAAQLRQAAAAEALPVIVVLRDQLDARTVRNSQRAERRRQIIQALQRHAERTQNRLRRRLRELRDQGQVTSFTPLWVQNAALVTASPAAINEIALMTEVAAVLAEGSIPAPPSVQSGAAPTPNLAAIGAPELWALGFRGQGVVVASLDTGVDGSHPDLAAQWRGGGNSWYDPYGQFPGGPTDLNGHGTWTMGVMVGGAGSGSAIGVAPEARWIAARVFNNSGVATTSALHLALQWLLDPDGNPQTDDAPDLVNNSWALGAPGCNLEFEPDLQALAAAGITPIFAAGNYGPGASTSVSPANNPSALAVGAVNNSGQIASTSGRGPTSCGRAGEATYPHLVAPGVGVLTSDLYGGYYTPSGTSLAAPHVAGGLALLLSAFPQIGVDQQRQALIDSATDLGAAGADNTYGAGRLNLPAAYSALLGGGGGGVPTATPEPPTATSTATPLPPTATPLPPTATSTATPPPPTATATAPAGVPGQIFADGFESGGLGAWTSATTGGARLKASAASALSGGWGLEAGLSGTSGIFVRDTTPGAETAYFARIGFDPNSAVTPNNRVMRILTARSAAGADLLRLELRRSAGSYQVRVSIRSGTSYKVSTWATISDAPHTLEVSWRAASSAGGTNGEARLFLDGALSKTVSGASNGADRVEEARLGPSAGIGSGSTGALYFDSFVSARSGPIGL